MGKCESCIVKEFNSLKALTRDELMRVSACKTGKTFNKGRVIFEEGDTINGVYCVKDGVCKLTKLSENGKDQVVKLIVKGGLLGKRSLVTNESSSLTATALTEMEMCFIPKAEILADLQKNPNFTLDVLQKMTEDLKESEHSIVNMAQKPVKKRMAEALLYIHDGFGTDEDGYLTIVLSREDYASIVGTATESAIRILSQFKKEGLISTSGKRIKIEDANALKWVE
ncbi:Crp/Fnr family transcriptional regulator [Winogradskyella jejuensis]|uniref:cAMP-binding domain of CRP or a regulatory subunit of cAMP-dependent protein kinases n=1 Tax=Winogradskyella jejuensis TaxID=1089305 RepID=A0A1M5SRM8_9FLAO|nr:Crp/Fnr family transcriptional regulator [Winogradskyella jejuensis]SHH41224.1 cAMP-binding domain of CRP or a regulatory subunit of cAMP-dependent protein kinases [Winogradskyella jejuensis]